jgi:aminopeptidase N
MLVHSGPGALGRSTSHEVGHMWFYGLVENDQGRDPWLDEGLASWAEVGYEGTLASFRTRPIPAAARGHLAEPTSYWDRVGGDYYTSVYVQGVQALDALGPHDKVDCALALYVATHAYRVARPADLVAALTQVYPDAPAVLSRYGVSP